MRIATLAAVVALLTMACTTLGASAAAAANSLPGANSLSPAEQSLLNGVQTGQATLFHRFDSGLTSAFGAGASGSPSFRRGQQSFLAAMQGAARVFLAGGSDAAFSGSVTRAAGAWQRRAGALGSRAPAASAFIESTLAAEVALWSDLARATRPYGGPTFSSHTFQATLSGAQSAFAKAFRRAVGALLTDAHAGHTGRAAMLRLLGVGIRGFLAGVQAGARGFLPGEAAPNQPGPAPGPSSGTPVPTPAPSSAPETPATPMATHLTLQCPPSAHLSEVLKISGTLSPAPAGASVQLLYEPPPSGTGTPPPSIPRQVSIAAGGEFSDASVTPEEVGGGQAGELQGIWMVRATYPGTPLYSEPIPQLCEISVTH